MVAILPQRHLNNGQPSLHAKLLAHAGPQAGEHVAPVGAGTGYYTAIMAHLVGSSGKVTAIELAARAQVNPTTSRGFPPVRSSGAVFRIERRSSAFLARWICAVAIFPCEAARDPLSEAALAEAFANGDWKDVTRLFRRDDVPEDRCWLRAHGWCFISGSQ